MSREDHAVVREEVVESMERSAEMYGLSRSAGRVYGVLYFADGPLSIPDLVEETGYAKSTISNVTRRLTRVGLLRRRSSDAGSQRVRFDPERDLWFVVEDALQQYAHREVSASRRTLDRASERLDSLDGGTETTGRRIEELRATYDELHALLDAAQGHSPAELVEAIEEYDEG